MLLVSGVLVGTFKRGGGERQRWDWKERETKDRQADRERHNRRKNGGDYACEKVSLGGKRLCGSVRYGSGFKGRSIPVPCWI